MNSNKQNLCDDWGWYIDTDENLSINTNVSMVYTPYKKMRYNVLDKVEEDEYDYYNNNNRDIENLELEYIYKNTYENSTKLNIYKIGSTTLITALITYTIFFLL